MSNDQIEKIRDRIQRVNTSENARKSKPKDVDQLWRDAREIKKSFKDEDHITSGTVGSEQH